MSNQSFKVKSGLTLTPVDLTTLLNPQAGDLACDINDSNKIKRYDATTSAWAEVGSGGVGSLDILFAQDFESASLSSFTQTGLALDTAAPLHGKVSAKLTHQAGVSPTNDQSFKQVIAVDRKFRGQAIVMRLNVKSSASAGNVTISIYDETNAASLLSSTQLQLSNEIDGISNAVSFTIPSTSSSISYTITALPEAGSPVTYVDDIVAELSNVALLETSVEVPVMTAWQGYIPTFQGFGTAPTGPTNVEFEWRQVGENVEIRGKFVSGTTTAVEARIGLPAGLTSAGTSLIPSIQQVGTSTYSGVVSGAANTILIEPSVTYVTVGVQTGGLSGLAKANANALYSSGQSISFFASVPCAGLSATTTKTIPLTQSGLVQEADSYITLSGASGYGTSATTIRRFSTVTSSGGTDIQYEDSPTLGGRFIAQESGIYHVTYSEENTASVVQASSILYVNGIKVSVNQSDYGGATSATKRNSVSWSGYLEQGDIVTAGANVAAENNGTFVYFSMVKQGSLKQISVSSDQKITIPTSELRFEGASARGSTATAIVKFDTMAKLRGDAFTVESDAVLGTRITMKKAGKLDVSVSLNNTVGTYQITKNQATLTAVSSTASEIMAYQADTNVNVATSFFVEIGDIIRVTSNVTPSAGVANSLNLSFQEQDIAVSVTNTLPQFSESDSSIRLTGAGAIPFGTTNILVRRFSTVNQNIGTDIEYIDSPTLGGRFIAKTDGIYNISYNEESTANVAALALFLYLNDSISLSSNRDRINTASTASKRVSVSWSGFLSAGDAISALVNTQAEADGVSVGFTISKVGKPNVTGVDVTPFVNVPQPTFDNIVLDGGTTRGSSNTSVIFSSTVKNTSSGIVNYRSSATLGTEIVALKKCYVNVTFSIVAPNATQGSAEIFLNNSQKSRIEWNVISDSVNYGDISAQLEMQAGDILTFTSSANLLNGQLSLLATALSDQILTAPETFSTDTASLQYASSAAYTLTTLADAPVGTYITFTYAANTNTRTQTTLNNRPSQTDADMNANGILLYSRAYNVPSTAGNPSAIAIQIGKGLKGVSVDGYFSTAKVSNLAIDYTVASSTTETGVWKSYNELTGILTLDVGYNFNATTTTKRVGLDLPVDLTRTSGYLVINASKNPALTGLGLGTVAARGINTSATSMPNGLSTLIYDAVKTYDTHGALNTSTGIFTAPETGYYQASWGLLLASAAGWGAGERVYSFLVRNGATHALGQFLYTEVAGTYQMASIGSCGVYLNKGDTVYIAVDQNNGAAIALTTGTGNNHFSIHKTSVGTGN